MSKLVVFTLFVLIQYSGVSQSWEPHYSFHAGQEFILTQKVLFDEEKMTVEQVRIHVDSVDQLGNAYLNFEEVKDAQLGYEQLTQSIGAGSEAVPAKWTISHGSVLDSGVFSIVISKYGEFLRGSIVRPGTRRLQQSQLKNTAQQSFIWSVEKECTMIVDNLIRLLPRRGVLNKGQVVGDTSVKVLQKHFLTTSGETVDDSMIVSKRSTFKLVDTCLFQDVPCYTLEVRNDSDDKYPQTMNNIVIEQRSKATCIMRRSDGLVLDEVEDYSNHTAFTSSRHQKTTTIEEVKTGDGRR